MRPPAFPLAPVDYSKPYIDSVLRILTQYLNQESADELKVEQKVNVLEVLQWLS